jgi:glycosyltransferase involved in cell wall biosynthesis
MRIVAICTPNNAPGYHRLFWPLFELPQYDIYISNYIEEKDVSNADIVMFNRHPAHNSVLQIREWRKKYGFKVIVDVDDYWILGPDHILHKYWEQFKTTETIIECLSMADFVICSTDHLCSLVKQINKNAEVVFNAINYGNGQFQNVKSKSEYVKLFWAGGITHDRDMELLRNPVKRIGAELKNVCMVMAGYQKEQAVWQRMASAFTSGKSIERIIVNEMPIEKYYDSYQLCDIALIPLRDNMFNACKSNLKVLEASGVNAPVIVSNTGPYKGFPLHIVNYVDSQSDWFKWVSFFMKNRNLIKEQGKQLFEYCSEHFNFQKENEKRKQIFEHVTGK